MARTPMLQAIVDADENRAGALISHPMQVDARALIVDMLSALPTARTPTELFEFQHWLLSRSLAVSEAASQFRRGQVRAGRGRSAPVPSGWTPVREPADADDWLFELTVADRLARQLRCVGDALAWKVFRCDRNVITALASNAAPGPIALKSGLEAEWGHALADLSERGEFALLHDLTNVLRISDMTVFTAEGPRLRESKSSAGGAASSHAIRQRRRAEQAIGALSGGPLPSSTDTVRYLQASPVQLRTHIPTLARLADEAARSGFAVGSLPHGLVVSVFDMWVGAQLPNPVGILATREAALSRIKIRRGPPGKHELTARLVDLAARDPHLAPVSVYPLSADGRAGLICDDVLVIIEQTLDPLAQLLEQQGLVVDVLLRNASGNLDAPTLRVRLAGESRALVVHGRILAQKLIELVDSATWAKAVAALVRGPVVADDLVVVYANERGVWGRSI